MSDNTNQKGLTGPFQDNLSKSYYVLLQNGEHQNLSPNTLAEGTTTVVVIEDGDTTRKTVSRTELADWVSDLRQEGTVTIGFTSCQPCP